MKLSQYDIGWRRATACILADMARGFGVGTEVEESLDASGLSIDQFKRAGVEEYDLKVLRQIFKAPRFDRRTIQYLSTASTDSAGQR